MIRVKKGKGKEENEEKRKEVGITVEGREGIEERGVKGGKDGKKCKVRSQTQKIRQETKVR